MNECSFDVLFYEFFLCCSLHDFQFRDVDPLEWARQLTLMESRLFSAINYHEFLKTVWSVKDGTGAPTIRAMIQRTNFITAWVAETILMEGDAKRRCGLMKHFINIADRCRQLNNFNTLMVGFKL